MRTAMVAAAVCVSAVGLAAAENAEAAIRRTTSIAPQGLGPALQALAQERDFQVVFLADAVEFLNSPGAVGNLTTDEALTRILSGSGMTFQYLDARTVTVVPARAAVSAGGTENARAGARVEAPSTDVQSGRLHESNGKDAKKGGLFAALIAAVIGSPTIDARADQEAQSDSDAKLEEIIITGTRIRGSEAANPSLTLYREALEASGFNSVNEVFRSLPQNLGEISDQSISPTGASRITSESADRINGVSLRGLGPQSTLVLINGRRYPGGIAGRVTDISSIPLAAVERIEVLTGGASALYGSDAVAGVVNIATRREFEGVETQAYYGFGQDGGDRAQGSVVAGIDRERGGFVAGYDYSRMWLLDGTDAGVVTAGPPPLGVTPVPGRFFLEPDQRRHSAFFSGRYAPVDGIELYGDLSFSTHDTETTSAYLIPQVFPVDFSTQSESEQLVGTVGALIDFPGDWTLDLSATSGTRDVTIRQDQLAPFPNLTQTFEDAELSYVSATIDGTAFQFGGVDVLTAFGAEYRDESYLDRRPLTDTTRFDVERSVKSVFGEIRVPLIDRGGSSLAHRLELMLAGRYDDYSDFGDTFNPQFGIIWSPTRGFSFRGSYSTSFVAPSLYYREFGERLQQVSLQNIADPTAPSGFSPTYIITGASTDLRPEEADTFTLSVEYDAPFFDRTKFTLSYFSISYEDRIDEPTATLGGATILINEASYGSLVDRSPDESTLRDEYDHAVNGVTALPFFNVTGVPFDPTTQNFLDVFPDLVLFDNRRTNIALEEVSGIDLQASSELATRFGDLTFGLNGLYYLEFKRAFSPNAAFLETMNSPGRPVQFRVRADAGWRRGAWSFNGFVNYVDSYPDDISSSPANVESWTTVDLNLRYDGSQVAGSPLLKGLSAMLAVENLFDEPPPFFGGNPFGVGYDGANANARGRFVSLQLRKRW